MSSKPPDDMPAGRFTGAGAIFLNRVKQAAAQKLADANQQHDLTIGTAHSKAWAAIGAAHQQAAEVLSQNLQGLYVLTDKGIAHADVNGLCAATMPLDGASSVIVDLGAQRIYWSKLVASQNPGRPDCAQADEIAFYPQNAFDGVPITVVKPMMQTGDYLSLHPAPLNFLPAGFKIVSLGLGPHVALTLFEEPDGLGRFKQFTQDAPQFNLDWEVKSYVVSRSYHQLWSANLDGTHPTLLASLPEVGSAFQNSGALALDDGRGLLFWMSPDGQFVRLDLSGAVPTTVFHRLPEVPASPVEFPGTPAGAVGLALDTVNQNLYWSMPEMFGTLSYDGKARSTLVIEAWRNLLTHRPITEEFLKFGFPAIEIAVDAPNGRLFCNNGRTIWRARLDGTTFLPYNRDTGQQRFEEYYRANLPCRGLSFDPATQMIYTLNVNDLIRINVDPGLYEFQVEQSVEKVFSLQGNQGRILDFALITSTGTATQTLMAAQTTRQQAHVKATQALQAARDDASQTQQKAQKVLDDAHNTAAESISDKQSAAASTRQIEQDSAQAKRAQAAAKINQANADAATARSTASGKAQRYVSQQQIEADAQKVGAQGDLDTARRKLQNA